MEATALMQEAQALLSKGFSAASTQEISDLHSRIFNGPAGCSNCNKMEKWREIRSYATPSNKDTREYEIKPEVLKRSPNGLIFRGRNVTNENLHAFLNNAAFKASFNQHIRPKENLDLQEIPAAPVEPTQPVFAEPADEPESEPEKPKRGRPKKSE